MVEAQDSMWLTDELDETGTNKADAPHRFWALRSAGESSWQGCRWRSDSDIMRCVTEDGLSLARMGDVIRAVELPNGSGDWWSQCKTKLVGLTLENYIQVCKLLTNSTLCKIFLFCNIKISI